EGIICGVAGFSRRCPKAPAVLPPRVSARMAGVYAKGRAIASGGRRSFLSYLDRYIDRYDM
ncbi:MAG: hypothetical protein AAFO77_08030, partial [Pseudomonadota bacterium]